MSRKRAGAAWNFSDGNTAARAFHLRRIDVDETRNHEFVIELLPAIRYDPDLHTTNRRERSEVPMVSSLPTLIDRIRREFTELPGLKLTPAQACRLWHVNEDVCRAAMTSLIGEGFLRQMPSGAFIALPSPRGRSLKAPLVESSSRPARCPHCHHLNTIRVERTVTAREISATFRCAACARVFSLTELSA
jgi:hypothetical protein